MKKIISLGLGSSPARKALAVSATLAAAMVGSMAQSNQTWTAASGTGSWDLSSANWDSGSIWTNNNNAIFSTTAATVSVTGPIVVNDATFNIGTTISTSGGSLSLGNDLSSTFSVASGITSTISSVIGNNSGGASSLTKSGSGTLVLLGANTYSGGTTVNGGILQVGNSTSSGATGSVTSLGAVGSTVTVNNGGNLRFQMGSNSSNAFAQNFVLNEGSVISYNDGRLTFGSATANTASNSYTIAVNGTTTLKPLWNTKQFILAGIVTGSGAINIVRDSNNGGQEAGYVVFLNGNNTYSGTVTTSGTYSATVSVNSMSAVMVGASTALQYASVVNNSVANTNSSGGPTEVNQRSGLTFNTTTATLGSLAGSGNFILSQNTAAITSAPNTSISGTGVALTLGGNNTNTTYSGNISGNNGSIIKTGSGVFTLSGANTYGGGTTVNAGTVLIANTTGSGTGTGAVAVNAGAFGGTGITSSAVTVASGATLQAGLATAASGGLTVSGNLTLNDGAKIQLTLGNSAAHSSLIRTGGVWDLDGAVAISFVDLGATVGTYSGIITGLAGSFDTSGWTITNSGWAGTFTYNASTNAIDVSLSAVPEPGVSGLVVAGLLAAVTLYRRRRCAA